MRKTLILIFGIIILTSCKKESKNQIENISKTKSEEFEITGLNNDDFKIDKFNDTTIYFKLAEEGLDGKKIIFDSNRYKNVIAKAKFNLGFLQYTTDDRPASPLDFTKQTEWINLKVHNGIIEIPDFYGNSENIKLYKVLGFKNENELSETIGFENFDSIKKESVGYQNWYYNGILKDKEEYKTCCPEYIKQAENFINTPTNNYKNINDLHLELYYDHVLIEIKAITRNKEIQIHKVLMSK
ncbi:hypothetical protein FCR2A7T_05670 [Flavobacterium cauense R2A-7]|uniref:Lipoprotein n=1 Tax=Flavobacterium cauense R2A-7 TaxID=1341154 RepID=V6S4N6_9FLAO|nr:hypothetical protein [Flavobacterium cauense]ESU21394.1 hypothetical protein FCR2A7T_05670 [Flavobacterium cauense R2A-7]KGO78787.1 hypothetical protein Q762_14915 [Flavobacterium cauense R2A-7]TWI08046.1 hypothetical protein IP98_02911 [Flavobacterium cauense R2A-7]